MSFTQSESRLWVSLKSFQESNSELDEPLKKTIPENYPAIRVDFLAKQTVMIGWATQTGSASDW